MNQSKNLLEATNKGKQETKSNGGTTRQPQETKKLWYKHCKEMGMHSSQNYFSLEANKEKRPQWYINEIKNKYKQLGSPGE